MLDFTLQSLGIATGLILGACLYSWIQVYVATKMGDSSSLDERGKKFWSLAHLDLLGSFFMFICHVGWVKPVFLRPRSSVSPRITMLLCVLLPAAALLLVSLALVAAMKLFLFVPGLAVFLESCIRTLLTIMFTMLLPIPPLDGWKVLSTLLWGDIRPANRFIFPVLLLCLLFLEVLTKTSIIALFFGAALDGLLSFLFLIA